MDEVDDGREAAREAVRQAIHRTREVSERGSMDPHLYFEVKEQVLDLLAVFDRHGFLSPEDVALALGRPYDVDLRDELAAARQDLDRVRTELGFERSLESFLQAENERLESAVRGLEHALSDERDLVKESLATIARLERQLRDARRTTAKLITVSREGLVSLKRVRGLFEGEPFANQALAPLVHDFRELTQAVQELHALALVKASAGPLRAPSP